MPVTTFKREALREMVWGDSEDLELIETKELTKTRWSQHAEAVFRHGEKFYRVAYSYGLTEQQDERPFDDSPEDVPVFEVRPEPKVIQVWVRV
jgi:hypothetical protein